MTPLLYPLITIAHTSKMLGQYSSIPMQNRIMDVLWPFKACYKNMWKGDKTITKYMLPIKASHDILLLMNVADDIDALTLKILNGLEE